MLMCLAIWGMLAITIYCLAPKKWGIMRVGAYLIVACLYYVMLIITIFYQPLFVALFGLVPIMAVLAMLKGKPRKMWLVVAMIVLVSAVYYLFDNDIAGPMQFRMSDRPIDTPSQWGNNWRLYWLGVYASTVAWIGGVISIVVLFLYRLYLSFSLYINMGKEHFFFFGT